MLERGADDACPDGFGEHQQIAGTRPGVGDQRVWMHRANDCHAEFGHRIVHGVPTGDHRPGLQHHVGAASLDLREHLKRQGVARKPGKV